MTKSFGGTMAVERFNLTVADGELVTRVPPEKRLSGTILKNHTRRTQLRDLQQRLKITSLFVTHGDDEATALADRIVVLRNGRSEQIDPPDVV